VTAEARPDQKKLAYSQVSPLEEQRSRGAESRRRISVQHPFTKSKIVAMVSDGIETCFGTGRCGNL